MVNNYPIEISLAIITVIVVVAIALQYAPAYPPAVSSSSTNTGSHVGPPPLETGGTVIVALTDPAVVPGGVTALFIQYSDVQLHMRGVGNSSGYVDTEARGIVDVLALQNSTETILREYVNGTGGFDSITMNISNATVIMDGKPYPIHIYNSSLYIPIAGRLNATSPVALIDIAAAVMQAHYGNTTAYAMDLGAAATSKSGMSVNSVTLMEGVRLRASPQTLSALAGVRRTLSIYRASIRQAGNITHISVSVTNNGNRTVYVRHVILSGYMMAALPAGSYNITSVVGSGGGAGMAGLGGLNATASVAAILQMVNSSHILGNLTDLNIIGMIGKVNSSNLGGAVQEYGINTKSINFSAFNLTRLIAIAKTSGIPVGRLIGIINNKANASVLADMHTINISNADVVLALLEANNFSSSYHNMLDFEVFPNGSLALPNSEEAFNNANRDYPLGPGKSETFSFNSTISFGNSHDIFVIRNQTYLVAVTGDGSDFQPISVKAG